MSAAARCPRQREQPAAGAFPLVIGLLRLDPAVVGNYRPVVPMSVRVCGHLWVRAENPSTSLTCRARIHDRGGDLRVLVGAWSLSGGHLVLVKISVVASTMTTKSVHDMIEALIAGERSPRALADLARGRMKTSVNGRS